VTPSPRRILAEIYPHCHHSKRDTIDAANNDLVALAWPQHWTGSEKLTSSVPFESSLLFEKASWQCWCDATIHIDSGIYCVQLTPDLMGLAWIQYMRWARRADSVNASRKLFVKARKWPQCPWQVGQFSVIMPIQSVHCPIEAKLCYLSQGHCIDHLQSVPLTLTPHTAIV